MTSEDEKGMREVLQHYLAALAYRTQKALRDAPQDFGSFNAGERVRTPHDLVHHMASVIGYARTCFVGGAGRPEKLPTLESEIKRFHELLEDLSRRIGAGELPHGISFMQLLQGPFSDAMTHVGQIALLRRLAGSPVPAESFVLADIRDDNLSVNQSLPMAPDANWRP